MNRHKYNKKNRGKHNRQYAKRLRGDKLLMTKEEFHSASISPTLLLITMTKEEKVHYATIGN